MPKFLFKSTQNRWFSQLTCLGSLALLIVILFKTYLNSNNLAANPGLAMVLLYLEYGIFCFVLSITAAAWFLKNQLTLKPFYVSFLLLLLIGVEFFITKQKNLMYSVFFAGFLTMVIHIVLFSVLWWLSSLTKPKKFALTDFANDKYRIWGILSLLFISLLVLLTTWLQAYNGGSVCINDLFCTLQVFSKNNMALFVNFWLSGKVKTAEPNIILMMCYYLVALISYIYIGIVGFCFIFNRNLNKIGLLIFCLFIFKVILDQVDITYLNPHTIAFIDFILLLLLLLVTISFLGQLYQKLQLKW